MPIAGSRPARDCRPHGAIVTPGFVDIHTHYDGQATWAIAMSPSNHHGVTTVVMGNCGVGFAPVKRADHDLLIELMEGVEDIPGARHARRPVVGLGDVSAVSRLSVAAPLRHGHRGAAAARRVARLRDGRARRESRTRDRGGHRADARARARSGRRRRDRFLDVAHAESPQQQRRPDAVADGRGRRTGRHCDGPEGCRTRRARADLRLRRSRGRVQHRRTDVGRERSPHLDLVGAGTLAERLEERSSVESRATSSQDA